MNNSTRLIEPFDQK